MEPLKIILLFLGIYSQYVEANICLTWEAEQNKLFLKCKVNPLLWGVYFYDPSNNQQGFCSFPIPSPNCFPNSSMQQDLRTNTTTLMIITGGIDSSIDGQWKCLHGRNLDKGVVDITVIKEGKSNEENLVWIFIGCLLCVLVILSLWILKKNCKKPTVPLSINAPQLQYNPTIGNNLVLECIVTGTATSVTWRKMFINNNGRFSNGNTGTPSLTISNVQSSDSDQYVCSGSDGSRTVDTHDITVSAQLPLSINAPQLQYNPTIGNNLVLQCIVTGTATSVTWRKVFINNNGRYSNGNTGTPSLTISNVQSSDSGQYVCSASDGSKTVDTHGITVSAQSEGSPSDEDEQQAEGSLSEEDEQQVPLSINAPQLQYNPTIGNNLVLQCIVTDTATSVTWRKVFINNNGRYSNGNTGTPSLTINNVQSSDSGQYVCSASDGSKTVDTHVITVSAQSVPTVRIQSSTYTGLYGNSVTLVCTVSAVPFQTNVYWKKGGFSLINSGDNRYSGSTTNNPSLTINSVTIRDQGTYICYATNIVGTSQISTTQLTVSRESEKILKTTEEKDPKEGSLSEEEEQQETDSLLSTNGQEETETQIGDEEV